MEGGNREGSDEVKEGGRWTRKERGGREEN